MQEDREPTGNIVLDLSCTVAECVAYLKLFNRTGFFNPDAASEKFHLWALRGNRAGATIKIMAPAPGKPSIFDVHDLSELAAKAAAAGPDRLLGDIRISMTGTGCRLMFLPSRRGDDDHYRRVCEVVSKQLHDGGLVISQSDTPSGGRRRDPDYEWASHQVHELGRDQRQVFKEWATRIGKARFEALADPWDSFRKGIKRKQ
jgi:hypothetical protein